MKHLESLFIQTRDSFGFPGVATYKRGEFGATGCRATVSDTASGHGWGGCMSRNEWKNHKAQAIAWAVPYRFSDGENWPEQATPNDCAGWMIWHKDGNRPFLCLNWKEAETLGEMMAKGEVTDINGPRNTLWPTRAVAWV